MTGPTGDEAATIVAALGLRPHPEGGNFVETFRDAITRDGRSASTAIYFLLRAGERSRWHRLRDAVEVWHHYAGAALTMRLSPDGKTESVHRLGPDIASGERPQLVVPAGRWQSAESTGAWTLVGCTVAPGFDFSIFEFPPRGWPVSLGR